MDLTEDQKKQNESYFRNILLLTRNGGKYGYPDAEEVYTIKDGVFYGTQRGVDILREITPDAFHKHIKNERII